MLGEADKVQAKLKGLETDICHIQPNPTSRPMMATPQNNQQQKPVSRNQLPAEHMKVNPLKVTSNWQHKFMYYIV